MENKKKSKKKIILIILIVIFSLVFLYTAGRLIFNFVDAKKNKKQYEELASDVVTFVKINEDEEEETFEIDFDKLKEINKDVVGWVLFNNKKVNYPIVQAKDNNYYLTHNIYKKYSVAGSVFLDYRNDSFNNNNTILYSHAMDDDTMFGSLKDLWKDDYFDNEENRYILVLNTNNELLKYEVFSYYITEMEEYYITPKFNDKNSYSSFIKTLKSRSRKKLDVEVSDTDKILTLSTCYGYGDTTKRRVVHAKSVPVEVEEENNEEKN